MGNNNYDVANNRREIFYRIRKSRLFIFIGLFAVLLVAVGLTSGLLSARYEREKARRCANYAKDKRSADDVKVAPYGSWKSPLSSKLVSSSSISFQDLRVDSTDPESVYWAELRPDEGGVKSIFSYKTGDKQPTKWTPSNMGCNSRVHEYGGAGFIVHDKTVYFVNQADQRIYVQKSAAELPVPLTKEGADSRYADCSYHQSAKRLICVKEDHAVIKTGAKEAENTIVMIDITTKAETVLVSGKDFYASPKISPDEKKLVWMQWSHPNMPWDDTEIFTADFNPGITGLEPSTVQKVIGQPGLNVMHPRWDINGSFLYISDETNWWNIYRQDKTKKINLFKKDIDFGQPQWKLGGNLFSMNSKGDIVFIYDKTPAIIDRETGDVEKIPSDDRRASDVLFSPTGKYVYMFGYSPVVPVAVIRIEVETKEIFTVRQSASLPVDKGYLTKPKKISFPTDNGRSESHGYLYLPKNKDFKAPADTKPPLLIMAHGGPTADANLDLDFEKQYYTSRGFAILDVDYRGSTGYGRKYRTSLYGNWGLYDMEDCGNGASYLALEKKMVDPKKLVITGGSAGGYTTLTSLTFTDVFAAGSSHYGISDVLILLNETHKFESRYIDNLMAPGEKGRKLARQRSPIYHLDKLNKPIAFFQGELDKVVPKNQAEKMFNAIKAKGLPCSFVLFKGEYHGFAKAENKQKALDGEFYFFSKLLKFEAADKGIEIPIENLR